MLYIKIKEKFVMSDERVIVINSENDMVSSSRRLLPFNVINRSIFKEVDRSNVSQKKRIEEMVRCNELNRQLLFLSSTQSQINNQIATVQQRLSEARVRIDAIDDILFPPVILLSDPERNNIVSSDQSRMTMNPS